MQIVSEAVERIRRRCFVMLRCYESGLGGVAENDAAVASAELPREGKPILLASGADSC